MADIVSEAKKIFDLLNPELVKKPKGFQKQMDEGKRVNVYLDAETLAAAKKLGNGNTSEGIRIALKMLAQSL